MMPPGFGSVEDVSQAPEGAEEPCPAFGGAAAWRAAAPPLPGWFAIVYNSNLRFVQVQTPLDSHRTSKQSKQCVFKNQWWW